MNDIHHDTVLLVCADPERSSEILSQFYDYGWSVVGPVSTAAMALSLTAHTCPTVALVAGPPTGKRNAPQLARDLMRMWGVRSMLLDEALEGRDFRDLEDKSWSAHPHQTERILQVISPQG
jgi:hypothetical protein